MKVLLQSVPRHERIELPRMTRHLPCNPSILFHEGKLLCAYRGCNYDLREGHYKFFYGSGPTRLPDTQSYLAELNADLSCKSVDFIEDRHIRGRIEFSDGVEDIRLVSFQGRLMALACGVNFQLVLQRKSLVGNSRMILSELKDRKLRVMRIFESKEIAEKNWMPVAGRPQLDLVYSVNPVVLLEDVTNLQKPVAMRRIPGQLSIPPARGGSCLMPWRDGYMCLVHHTNRIDGQKHYTHQVLIFDASLGLVRASEIFTFEGERVEFCAGLAIDGDTLYISYGIMDCKAVVLRLAAADLMAAVF